MKRRNLMLAAVLSPLLTLAALPAQAAESVKIAIGGASCLCYLPTVLAQELGLFEKHGVQAELVDFKGGSDALKAVTEGSADVVSGFYEHTINMAAKQQAMSAFVTYDRFPGLVIVVAPGKTGQIKSIADLAGRTVGVTAPGSSTDLFLKYLLGKAGKAPNAASVVGVGLGDTAIAALEQGQVDAAVTLEPAVTVLQTRFPDLGILADTRSEADTRRLFGSDYPGAALYTMQSWIDAHPESVQGMTDAIVESLRFIHAHSPEEIMAQMPAELVGADQKAYLAALKNSLPMYSKDGMMDPRGAETVLKVFSAGSPEVKKARVDLGKTYTNAFVEKALATTNTQ
ncbi:MAG: ABC transporter substrate-binding protein [Paracoccus sp. (in: a-proteobacteria)]|uniref:ABC transporter substrate-binding protein n=1 Tax=Paracoccus sp. TaxID=267 RepID=UPI0039E233A1